MDSSMGGDRNIELERKKVRLELWLIFFIVLVVIGLTILATNVVRLGPNIPMSNSIFFFTMVNVNAVLLIGLLFLILRNLYRLFFVSQMQLIKARLRTKLVIAFICLSIGPTLLLVFTSLQFIVTSQDYWFNNNVEKSLVDSLEVGQYYLDLNRKNAEDFGAQIKQSIDWRGEAGLKSKNWLKSYLENSRARFNFSQITLYDLTSRPIAIAKEKDLPDNAVPRVSYELLKNIVSFDQARTIVDSTDNSDLVQVMLPLKAGGKKVKAVLVLSYYYQLPLSSKLQSIAKGLDDYRELKEFRDPIKLSNYLTLALVALLIIFASTWFGYRLAGGITGPIMELAAGTERIAEGDYDFSIQLESSDEIGTLVSSFNKMTKDLKYSKTELTQKNIELTDSYAELDQRRRYMEFVLQNVAAGVVSADTDGKITTINNSALEILKASSQDLMDQDITALLDQDHEHIIEYLLQAAKASPRGSAENQARIKIGEQTVGLHLYLTLLKDEQGQDLGCVIVFDDLTEIEKAQRMAAWREVARRIAHEIKNPLTPIQLSAQRLKKRYGHRFGPDDTVFDDCTSMITRQVDELKRLVNEFSSFARMPAANPAPNDLARIVEETLEIYKEGHKDISFGFKADPSLPPLNLDREQIQRVLINLLDNAVAAVENQGNINLNINFDRDLKIASLEIADDGVGINAGDKDRLFDPYYSTKKSGTGLGLAIVSTIVADHNGFIRVLDNTPRGVKFIIELPASS